LTDNSEFVQASDFALGAVLENVGSDGKWHPVVYISRSLRAAERNYFATFGETF